MREGNFVGQGQKDMANLLATGPGSTLYGGRMNDARFVNILVATTYIYYNDPYDSSVHNYDKISLWQINNYMLVTPYFYHMKMEIHHYQSLHIRFTHIVQVARS